MDVSGIISWVSLNWVNIIEVYLQIVGAASILVKLTPTLKDDDILKGIVRFVGKYLALNRGSTGA